MDYVTQHFIAAAKKLREELRDIAGKLFLLHEDIQEQTEAINKANETQAKRNESTPILRAELHIPDAVQAQKETSDRKKHSLDLFMTVVQTITMVAVVAYAVINAKQLRKMENAVVAANRSAKAAETANVNGIKAERPWIGSSNFSAVGFAPDVVTNVSLTILNAGKRPAYVILQELGSHEYSTFPENPFYDPLKVKPSHAILVPGISATFHWKIMASADTFKRLVKNESKFYIYSHVEYRDVGTGETHTTRVCEIYLPEYNDFFICEVYNHAD